MAPARSQQTSANNGAGGTAITLLYSQSSHMHVRGPISGKTYQFSGAQPLQTVDPRDVTALLETGLFRRA
jgi:hypothetical protein